VRQLRLPCRRDVVALPVDCKGHDVLLWDFRAHSDNCTATLLMPLPDSDFDPTESGVPWCTMRDHGYNVVFATRSGRTARADPKMVTGGGLGILATLLKADSNERSAYLKMEQGDAFRRPISYGEIRAVDFDALLLPGGHAPGMRVYLGSGVLQSAVADFFAQGSRSARSVMASCWRRDRRSIPASQFCMARRQPLSPNRWNLSPGG
jgi:hypothetical protein